MFFCPVALRVSFMNSPPLFVSLFAWPMHFSWINVLNVCCVLCLKIVDVHSFCTKSFGSSILRLMLLLLLFLLVFVICYFYHYYHHYNFVLSMLFYRFQVNILPRGLIPHGYTILCPQHHLERTCVCMYVFYLPSIIKL